MAADSEKAILSLLMETGYIACGMREIVRAQRIFKGVASARPESELPWIGLGILMLNSGKAEESIQLLRDHALHLNPESDLAKSFLGLAYKEAGYNHESFTILNEVSRSGHTPEAVAMANGILQKN